MRRSTTALVVLVVLAAGASYRLDLGARWFGTGSEAASTQVSDPAEVPPPPGLSLPQTPRAVPVADPAAPREADPEAVRRTVRSLVSGRRLGPDVAVAVSQLADGRTVYRTGPARVVPASTLKLLTTAAALVQLGGEHRFATTVVAGKARHEVILVGGGDPFLARKPGSQDYPARADIETLAGSTARALRELGTRRVRLGYDASMFMGPSVSPRWEASYVPDNVVSPISALWVDEGRAADGFNRSADPARAAARAFTRALRSRKITVVGQPLERSAKPGAVELAAVQSAPLAQIVERVLDVSDNEAAEVLARQVAVAAGKPGSFAGAARAVANTLRSVGVVADRDRIYDGSGLSRENRLAPETILSLLETASSERHPELRPVLTGMPVAGFTGSLTYRFDAGHPLGPGVVRAKTGSLSRVQSLAGTVTTRDGAVLVFVATADRVRIRNTLYARALLDRVAAALAGCRCAA
ncbi:hypothetical protein BH18ACT9_BH18ACT9_03290 [soil metagenome]